MLKYLKNAAQTGLGSGVRTLSSSLFGAASSFLSGAVSDYFARQDQERQFKYQQRLMREQDSLNRAAVDRQNAYNDPSAVSARARAAGVAPSVLLGGSAGSPGVSSLQSSASSGSVGSGSRPGSSTIMDWLSKAQFDNIEANTAAANADAADKQASADLKKQSLADVQWYNANVRELDQKLKSAGVDKAEADAAIAQAEEAYQKWMLNPDDPSNSQAAAKLFAAIDNLKALTGEANASAELKKEQKETEISRQGLFDEQAKTEIARQGLFTAEELSAKANKSYLESMKLNQDELAKYNQVLSAGKKIQNLRELFDFVNLALTNVPPGCSVSQYLGSLFGRVSQESATGPLSDELRYILTAVKTDLKDDFGRKYRDKPFIRDSMVNDPRFDNLRKLFKNLENQN